MIRVAAVVAVALAGCLALAGCSGKEEATLYDAKVPLDKMSTPEWCAYYTKFLTNPQLSAKNREVDLQRMRARGCPMSS